MVGDLKVAPRLPSNQHKTQVVPSKHTPWKFSSSPLKLYRDPKGKACLPTIMAFRGFNIFELRALSLISARMAGSIISSLKSTPPLFLSCWQQVIIQFLGKCSGPKKKTPNKNSGNFSGKPMELQGHRVEISFMKTHWQSPR